MFAPLEDPETSWLERLLTDPAAAIVELGIVGLLAVVIFGVVFWFCSNLKDSPRTRALFETWLTHDTVGTAYRSLLRVGLNWLDERLCSEAERELPVTDGRRAWSTRLLSVMLVLALAYPILSLLIRWTFANSGMVGGLPVLPPDDRDWLRYATLGLIVLSLIILNAARQSSSRMRLALQIVAFGAYLGFLVLAFAFSGAGVAAVAVGFVALLAFVGALASSGLFAVAFAASLACVVAFELITTASAAAGAVGGAIFGARAIGMRMNRLASQQGWPTLLLGDFGLLALVLAGVALALSPGISEGNRGAILFIGILPLFNGLADFASIGLTRWSLQRGVEGRGPLPVFGVIDVLGAVVIFLALGCGIISFIHVFTPRDGIPLIDLGVLFAELTDPETRGQYWWLLFTLFSTLIPTIVHLIIWAIAFFTVFPGFVQRHVARLVAAAAEDVTASRMSGVILSTALTLAIIVPVALTVGLIRWWPAILDGTIWLFESYARLIGAVA
ncbi:MAG: hypothetical protein AAFY42_12220 [Pseudomonadota bacterium]